MIEVAPTRMLSLGLSWGLPAVLLVALVGFAVGSGRARQTNVVTIDEIPAGPVGPAVSAGRRPAYSERSGRPLSGAVDIAIEQGDILWLSG